MLNQRLHKIIESENLRVDDMKSRRIKIQDVDERTSGEGEKEVLKTDESDDDEEEE